jgi:DNA (cytosine-5)-methyltransferase 1
MTTNVDLKDETPTFGNVLLPAGAVGLRVLSLFDGMSCGQQALERIGVNVLEYYASEIDKHAIAVTMHNYPQTKQLGSVVDLDGYKLPKIDLLIGGSPCQSFSFAGKRKGMATKCETEILTLEHYLELKAEGYEFEGQSYLFWEYMRLLNEVKPKYFLLENVEMGEKWEKVLSRAIGVNGIHINSALVSAQNRKRIYWTNIGMIPGGLFGDLESIIKQPKNQGILLKDILEMQVDEKYFLSEKALKFVLDEKRLKKKYTQNGSESEKSLPHLAKNQHNWCGDFIVHNTMPRSSTTGKGGTGHLSRTDGKTYCLDTGNTNAVEIVLTSKDKRLQKIVDNNTFINGEVAHLDTYNQTIDKHKSPALKLPHNDRFIIASTKSLNENQQKKFNPNINSDKANALTLAQGRAGSSDEYMDSVSKIANITSRIRRLTPIECERLQTVADNYTNHVSDSQRYKMLGNGWTIDVIAHILSYGKWT